jgi:hypothetical protein
MLQDKTKNNNKLLDNSDKEIDNTIPNKVKIEQTPIY